MLILHLAGCAALYALTLPTSGRSDFATHRSRYEAERPTACGGTLADGTDVAVILAYDHHHAGAYGYVWADRPLQASEITTVSDTLGCGEWYARERIDEEWWAVENRLG